MATKIDRMARIAVLISCAFALYVICWLLALITSSGLALYVGLIAVAHGGMALMRWTERSGSYTVRSLFDPSTQSWAFMFGDLALAWSGMWLVRLVFGELTADDWAVSMLGNGWWFVGCFAAGLAAGAVFHAVDARQYQAQDRVLALQSATKLWHDLVVYPVFVGLLLYFGLPAVASGSPALTMVALGLVCWVMFGIADTLAGRLAHPEQHPNEPASWLPA